MQNDDVTLLNSIFVCFIFTYFFIFCGGGGRGIFFYDFAVQDHLLRSESFVIFFSTLFKLLVVYSFTGICYPRTQRFLAREAKRRMRETLWVHTLGPLNVPTQSEAIVEVSESDFDSDF